MAPKPKYEAPPQQLRMLLEVARREGLSFDDAWERAIAPKVMGPKGKLVVKLVMTTTPNPPEGALRWPTDPPECKAWQKALRDSRDAWRDAYEHRERTPRSEALSVLKREVDDFAYSTAA